MAGWGNPDVDLLHDINGIAAQAPPWVDRTVAHVGEYGILASLALIGLVAWWSVRRGSPSREAAVAGVAGLVWAALAAGVAVLVNIPIRGLVERPRPFLEYEGLEVLVDGKRDFSFVSDHATLAMALAIGVFLVHRRLGLTGIALAVLEAFSRVYMGVHYPTDVIGGLALGTAVALLFAPVAMWLLTPLIRSVASSDRVGGLVRAAGARDEAAAPGAAYGADADVTAGGSDVDDGAPGGAGPERADAHPSRSYGEGDRDLAA